VQILKTREPRDSVGVHPLSRTGRAKDFFPDPPNLPGQNFYVAPEATTLALGQAVSYAGGLWGPRISQPAAGWSMGREWSARDRDPYRSIRMSPALISCHGVACRSMSELIQRRILDSPSRWMVAGSSAADWSWFWSCVASCPDKAKASERF
jgi:hypothetical protein